MVAQRLVNGLTASGIIQMRESREKRDAVSVRVAADGDDTSLQSPVGRVIQAAFSNSLSASPWPDMPDTTTGSPVPRSPVFGFPTVKVDTAYTSVKNGLCVYRRLEPGNADRASGEWDNYGADYDVTLVLKNPTNRSRPVGLFFEPEAGLAAGVFRIDGGPVQEFNPVMPPDEREIERYNLQPGETRTVQIQTLR